MDFRSRLEIWKSVPEDPISHYWQSLVVARFLDPPLFFFSMEVSPDGCLTTSHTE